MRVERMIEMDVAKPFRMLSANLITAAMTKPPKAYRSMWCKYKTQITRWHIGQHMWGRFRLYSEEEEKMYLKSHHSPRHIIVPLKESILKHSFSIVHKHSHKSKNQSKYTWDGREQVWWKKYGWWLTNTHTSGNLKQKLVNNGYQN